MICLDNLKPTQQMGVYVVFHPYESYEDFFSW